MMSDQENETSDSETWKSLAAICAVICSSCNDKFRMIENILKRNYCLNHPIPAISECFKEELIGNTILYLALKKRDHDTFSFLINQGADFTLKNLEGETVLHQAFCKSNVSLKECDKLWGKLNHPYIGSVLSAHVKSRNSTNPSNKNGLTHFHIACMNNHFRAVNFFLQNGVSIDEAVNFDSTSLAGYSPLHFAARYSAYDVAIILLEHGADVNAKDARGTSPLHLLIERNAEIAKSLNTGSRVSREALEEELSTNETIMDSFLDHVSSIESCIVDDTGLTCLHVACTLSDTSLAEKLLQLGDNIELTISSDCPMFPGYTPLHFAAHFNIETVKLLINHGADILSKDARCCTPFDTCLKKMDIARDLHVLIGSQPSWRNVMFSDGKTSLFDFAFAMRDKKSLSSSLCSLVDVNMRLDLDSPLWAGYTPLHLLVLFAVDCDVAWKLHESGDYGDDSYWCETRLIDSIELCLKLGADLAIQDPRGYSPLHLAFHHQKIDLIREVLLKYHVKLTNPIDENGMSHFHIACIEEDSDLVARLLESGGVDVDSPVGFNFRWCRKRETLIFAKGSTPLHIAVITGDSKLVKILLKHRADPLAKDDDSLTPVHRLLGCSFVYKDLADAVLSYNLCFMNDDVVSTTSCGLTFLHVVSYWNNEAAVEKLLNLGADVNARITYKREDEQESGRSRHDNIQSERSIDSLTFLARYTGYTPLQFAMDEPNDKIVKTLLQRGADIFARNSNGMVLVYDTLTSTSNSAEMVNLFTEALSCDATLQTRMMEDSGLTMLHVACATINADLIRNLCGQGLDVNARAHVDSPVWPGCTPLHVLMIKSKDNVGDIVDVVKLLLDCGADVTLANADQKTPLHEDFERFFIRGHRFPNVLLRAQKDFSINPVSIKGISHFHIACSCKEVAAVKEFLKHGADVNLPINYFCELYGGLTPIHLASVHHLQDIFIFLKKRCLDTEHAYRYYSGPIQRDPLYVASIDDYQKTVDVLLQHGANPNTGDSSGNTSLHVAAASGIPLLDVSKSLIRAGAEVNVENFLDETPLALLLSSETLTNELVEFFLRHGCKINIYDIDPYDKKGLIPRIFEQYHHHDKDVIQTCLCEAISNVSDYVNYFDEIDRSLIHNVVAHNPRGGRGPFNVQHYMKFIEDFGKIGHDVDHEDENDQTALHLAIEFQNSEAVLGLLNSGADINVLHGRAVAILSEALRKERLSSSGSYLVLKNLSIHVYKLKLFGIYVNSINRNLDTRIHEYFSSKFDEFERSCANETELAKSLKIEPHPVTLHDFLSETGVVGSYPRLPLIQRQDIADFFQNNGAQLCERFPQLFGVMKLQYRKALDRVALLEPAKDALSILMKLKFPDLCSEMVLRFLTNEDLENLTESADIEL